MSVVHDIEDTAARRLASISKANGYSFDVREVILPRQTGDEYTPTHLAIVVTGEDPLRESEHDRPGNPPALGYSFRLNMECTLIPSRHDCETFDQLATVVGENIVTAITFPPDWYRFENTTINANIEAPIIKRPENDGGIGSVIFTVETIYRVSETRPNQIRG